jgi:hypothetical protein
MSFGSYYRRDATPETVPQDASCLADIECGAPGLISFMSMHGGGSYERGLYRVHTATGMTRWTEIVTEAFPKFRLRFLAFACDWLGRHFALDYSRMVQGQFQVLMMEPGTGKTLEIPTNFMEFHDRELVEYRNEALACDFYLSWLADGGKHPRFEECVGYKKPLFLGGSDILENLELSDMDVYWSVCGQLLTKVRGLPEGTRVGDVGIAD